MVSSLIPFGFIPVIAYLLTDIFAGNRRALWAALAVGAAEMGFAWSGAGRPDWLALGGFVLLAGLILASLRTGDDFYFKIHGAMTGILSAAVLLAAWYGFDRALLLDLTADQIGLDKLAALDPRLTEETVAEMLRLLSYQLPWWLLLHALFILFAAINWGKWTWALVRVPGFLMMIFLASAFTQGAVIDDLKEGEARVQAARDSAAAVPAGTARDSTAALPGPAPEAAPDTVVKPAQGTVK